MKKDWVWKVEYMSPLPPSIDYYMLNIVLMEPITRIRMTFSTVKCGFQYTRSLTR